MRLRFRLFEFDSVRVLYVVIFIYPYYLDAADGLYKREAVLVGHAEQGGGERFRLFEFDSVRVLYVIIFVYPYYLDASDGLYQREAVLV